MFESSVLMDQGMALPLLVIATLKGTIMLAAAGLLSRILKHGSAAVRHALWCTALFGLLVFFVGANGWERWQVPVLPAAWFSGGIVAAPVPTTNESATETLGSVLSERAGNDPQAESAAESASLSWQSVILILWLVGALLVFARLVVGTITVQRLVRSAAPLTDSSCSALIDDLSRQLKLARRVRVLRSTESVMPMTCGALSAVVLLPNEADEWSADRRRVVLMHELIHVKRRDLLTQTLAQFICALYWFNPLVWFAVGQLRKEQEWACDERVVASGIKASDYAGHLLEIGRRFQAREWPAVTTTAIVRCSQLEQRLRAILKPALRSSRTVRVKAASISVLSGVFVLLAGTQLVGSERAVNNPLTLGAEAESERRQPPTPPEQKKVPEAAAKQSPENNQSPRPNPSPPPASKETGDDEMAEQVFNSFSVEDRNRLMNNGIGPAYIKEMATAGYRKLTAAQLIALYSNTVRADYVASLGSVGYPSLSPAELIALRSNGITADLIKSFQAVKYADFQAGNYIAFRSNGVPPSYLKSMSAAGYDQLTPKQIVDLWVAGVNADFIREARRRSQTNLSPEELIELKKRLKP